MLFVLLFLLLTILCDSDAILKYLATTYNVPDHWYPKLPEKRARVDEYTAWHHANTRMHASTVFLQEVGLNMWLVNVTFQAMALFFVEYHFYKSFILLEFLYRFYFQWWGSQQILQSLKRRWQTWIAHWTSWKTCFWRDRPSCVVTIYHWLTF